MDTDLYKFEFCFLFIVLDYKLSVITQIMFNEGEIKNTNFSWTNLFFF